MTAAATQSSSTMTAEALAAKLGVDVKTVYAGLARGEIPARRVGRRWIIVEQVIDDWLASPPEPSRGARRRTSAASSADPLRSPRQAPSSGRQRR